MSIIKKFSDKFIYGRNKNEFDSRFYLNHYSDLTELRYSWQAHRHYLRDGKREGRFANEQSYLRLLNALPKDLQSQFEAKAYKFYNPDLAKSFKTDEQLWGHYLRHGFREGRRCQFPVDFDIPEDLPDDEKWQGAFSTSEFLAWCGGELEARPASRSEALEIFRARGIDNLWPISFEYAFDVAFVRSNKLMPTVAGKSDADLYRSWLKEGFPLGIAPNERVFLSDLLGELPFPEEFDWKSFAKRTRMSRSTTRSQALVRLFDSSTDKVEHSIDLMGQDAHWLLDQIGRHALSIRAYGKAAAMFVHSLSLEETAETLCLLGDARREQGFESQALDAYLAAIAIDGASIWPFLHAATIYSEREQFAEAFEVLRKGHPVCRHKAEFSLKLHEIVDSYFDNRSAVIHALYRESVEGGAVQRTVVDTLLTDVLDEISEIYAEMGRLPARTGGDPEGYVTILANDDLPQCVHYRIDQKALQFKQAGIPVRIFSHGDVASFLDSLVGARSAIFYRVAAVPSVLLAILYANGQGLDTYYEVDDLIFDSDCHPDPFESFEGQITSRQYSELQFGVPLFRYAMSLCKGSIASTPALAERMRAVTITDKSIIVRNGLDERNLPAIRMGAMPILRGDGRIRIFYGSGTLAHNADFNRLVGPALVSLMERYPHIDLVIVGHLRLGAELAAMKDRIIKYPFIRDVNAYWALLAGCDINLAVLEPSPAADCKSEIKWLEAAALQIPSIVSGTSTYLDVVDHGLDGFVVNDAAGWLEALEELICKPQLRSMMGAAARTKALQDYDLEVGARALKSAFAGARTSAKEGRLRVLVCNVFFSPQSHGGATRAVEDNVRDFAARYPDLDIGVFCTSDGATAPGSLRMDQEGGIPVYRLSVPQEAGMDWRPFNTDNAEPFERVLNHFRPDIIHFHCIQRLTATIVEVAVERRIPYLVSLHDAWWISDHQFLVDEDGLLRMPSRDVIADSASGLRPLTSMARRQRLTSLLQHAEANLSVSDSFARVYEDAGVAKVRVVENGAPSITDVVRTPRADGRVALGHIGGRASHKGASLIEAALRRGSYANLHLTIVDGNLASGQSVDTTWGTTPVTMTAPYSQSQVGRLYSQLDVLLAPSTWPESFGLVAREAFGGGLWLVASNLGAIGQDVDEGRNGFVIDVSSTIGLSEVLSRIDADPGRYRTAPAISRCAARSMADQARELHSTYRRIVLSTDKGLGRVDKMDSQSG